MKIRTRILTYHFLNNYGAVLFADSVQRNLNQYLENSENKTLNYKDPKIRAYEWFKQFKLFPQEPFFYYKREKIFRAYRQRLKFDHQFSNTFSGQSLQKYLRKQEFDAVITGMDTWCVTNKRYRSSFPNAYWLPGELRAKKIAYAVSSYDSQPELIENNKEEIKQLVNDFSLIGVRDQFTYEMVLKYSENPSVVSLIPDPTFLYPIKKPASKINSQNLELILTNQCLGCFIMVQTLKFEKS